MRSRVLVVDDDDALREALARALSLEGYDVAVAEDGLRALAHFGDGDEPDVVVLDVLMPNLDGIGTCRLIRNQSNVPILMLTARDQVTDKVSGLDAGADDYLSKPFAVTELLARLRALLRRTMSSADTLQYADIELNVVERSASRGTRRIELTRTEFALLELFLRHPRKALHRSWIVRQVWGHDIEYASNSLDVFVGSLRRKTEAAGEQRLLQTVRGIGYALRENEP